MSTHPSSSAGVIPFFRQYTKTWLHALATAALTAFGALAVFHRGFVVLAITVYVLPPIVLYLVRSTPTDEMARETTTSESDTEAVLSDTADSTDPQSREPTGGEESKRHWTEADSPTDAVLFDVTVTEVGACAVGNDGVVLISDSEGWQTALTDGPGADSNTLRGVDSTANGEAVWFAGDGGAVARLDGNTGQHVDYSAPEDYTSTWEDVAVGGVSGDELVLLVNGSGEVLRGRYRDGNLAWDDPTKPGSGSSLSAVALAGDSVGYLCDTNDTVFETTDGGETFRQIGIDGVNGTLTDIATGARGDCTVCADDGVLHRYSDGVWTPVRLGDETLEAIAFRGEYGLACGGNLIHERNTSESAWERSITSVTGPLKGVSAGADRAVAVGSSGAIVERT